MIVRVVRLAIIGCFLASPWIMNRALVHSAWIPAAAAIAAIQGFAASRALPRQWQSVGGILCTILPALLVMAFPQDILAIWPGLLQAVIYTALLLIFVRSLQSGRTAIITFLATMIRGPLPLELVIYTRRVTMVWCVFFASQILISLSLYVFAARATWIFFVAYATWPLVAVMFMAEFLYRRHRLRSYRIETLAEMARLFAVYRADRAKLRA